MTPKFDIQTEIHRNDLGCFIHLFLNQSEKMMLALPPSTDDATLQKIADEISCAYKSGIDLGFRAGVETTQEKVRDLFGIKNL